VLQQVEQFNPIHPAKKKKQQDQADQYPPRIGPHDPDPKERAFPEAVPLRFNGCKILK
jgi:hypothetical protein